MRTVWTICRLLLAIVICAAASLVLVQAPTIPLFLVALVETEFGHWLFIVPLVLAFLPARRTSANIAATALCLFATMLLLSSVIRAGAVARHLPEEMAQAFPPKGEAHESAEVGVPLSWKKLWFAPEIPAAAVESLVYATRENRALRLFYSHDAAVPMAPCVIMIHGGGWESGTPREFPKFSDHLVQHGYAVADIEYRFAPRWPWPAQREDVLDAITYLKTHAAQLHLDPQRFVLLGRSAGGQIAEAVAYGAGRSEIRGCIAFYAPADMHYAYEFARADDILNSLRLVRQYLGGTPTEVRDNYDSASGILLASHDSPPTLLIHGRRDELVWFRQSQRLSNRLDALGVPHCFVQLPWATHAFDYNFNGPGGQISTYAVDTFLGSVLR
jgi:acetyl esterase/lipase